MPKFAPTTENIRDAQQRLVRIGHDVGSDASGEIGPRTSVALQAFQRQRGLPITGQLDSETWSRLHEAGWTLGSRLLFTSRPYLRGDDVAILQEALALLGFDPGRIDGIFGPLTAHALEDFQRNCGLSPDGVLTRATLNELTRLSSRTPGRQLVTEARGFAGLDGPPRRRVVVLHGTGGLVDALAIRLASIAAVIATGDDSDHDSAAAANQERAGLVLSVVEDPERDGLDIHFYESYRSRSHLGQRLALEIAAALAGTIEARTSGMSLPILRETIMPALALIVGSDVRSATSAIVDAIATTTSEVIDSCR